MPRATPPVPVDLEEARQAAYAMALRLLSGRDLSAARIRERIRARGFSGEVVDETAQRLTAAGILDDRRAAHAAARTLVTVRQRGRHRVDRELERMGFPPDVARDAVQAVFGETDERAVIDRVVAARLRAVRAIPDAAAYRRLYGSLLRRGFPADLIRAALRPYWRRGAEPEE